LITSYGEKRFQYPRGVAIGPNDEVIVVDKDNGEVIILDKNLNLISVFGQGSGDSKLDDPIGIAASCDIIAVSGFSNHVIKKFSLQGELISKFGSHGSADGQFNHPQGPSFNSKGLLYVVDHGNCRIQVFNKNNNFLFKFGSQGCNPGQFMKLRYIAIDSSDLVYATDQWSHCSGISVFSEHGNFIRKVKCNHPFAIFVSPDDYILTDDNNYSLVVYSPTHQMIVKLGKCGNRKGQFNGICGIAINSCGTIFIAENNNKRLQYFTR